MKPLGLAWLAAFLVFSLVSCDTSSDDDWEEDWWEETHICFECEGSTLYTTGDIYDLGLSEVRLGSHDKYPKGWCDTHIYEGNSGGEGRTLQLIGCSDSVWAFWAFNSLYVVAVRAPWGGMTDTGLRIGDTLEDFLFAYPGARHREHICDDGRDRQCDKDFWTTGHLVVNFDMDGNLCMMQLTGDDDYDDDESDVFFDHIGPAGEAVWE